MTNLFMYFEEALVSLAEEFVEQVSLGLVVPVSCGAAGKATPKALGSDTYPPLAAAPGE